MPPIILSPINMNVSIDHRVEHRHGDDVVRMERLGETVIHKDEQDRKWGAETFACGDCGQEVLVLTDVKVGDAETRWRE